MWAVVIGVLLLTLTIASVQVGQGEPVAAAALFALTTFIALLFWSVLPRRYELRADRLRVVMGWPFAMNVPFDTIAEIRPARGIDALAYRGLRFAPSVKSPVEVRRSKGPNLVISPYNRQEFIQRTHQALSNYRLGMRFDD